MKKGRVEIRIATPYIFPEPLTIEVDAHIHNGLAIHKDYRLSGLPAHMEPKEQDSWSVSHIGTGISILSGAAFKKYKQAVLFVEKVYELIDFSNVTTEQEVRDLFNEDVSHNVWVIEQQSRLI